MDESHVDALFARYVEHLVLHGTHLEVDELAAGDSEVAAALRERIGDFRRIDEALGRRPKPLTGTSVDGYRVSAAGAPAEPFTTLEPSRQENAHRWPQFLPEGDHLLYVVRSSNPGHTGVYLRSLDADDTRKLLSVYSSTAYFASGHLLYVRGAALMAQPFDLSRLALAGDPFPLIEKVGSFEATGRRMSRSRTTAFSHTERTPLTRRFRPGSIARGKGSKPSVQREITTIPTFHPTSGSWPSIVSTPTLARPTSGGLIFLAEAPRDSPRTPPASTCRSGRRMGAASSIPRTAFPGSVWTSTRRPRAAPRTKSFSSSRPR
jgi:hypothetical protein